MNVKQETKPLENPTDPNDHFNQWLIENKYKVSIEALTDKNPYLKGKGYVLTDKPLLVVTIRKETE